jgi:3'-phosphoadenosine 5'-phosphosulfate sulfotransferase (PAPS reductase)/FAD synthetase
MSAGDNPYLITGPALISFSGGRTSAYMLRMILDAHGGNLPDDVHVCFANTGKEREETLRFVHECESRWGVRVNWLERRRRKRGDPFEGGFVEVGYNSASRNGEPFAALIAQKQYLPNSQMRYCTQELKIRVMRDFMKAKGYSRWDSVIGLRGDEMHRVFKAIERNQSNKEPQKAVMPMATRAAGYVRQEQVQAFWKAQDFDLGIHSADGNCDLCFLKARQSRARRIRQEPSAADWWIAQERAAKCSVKINGIANARFHADESVEMLRTSVLTSPTLDLGTPEDADFDAECGLWCAGDDHDALTEQAA